MDHPKRMVVIQGAAARAFQRAPKEFRTVSEAGDADAALGDDGNEHHCPLCNEFFGTQAFKRHAASCIKTRAPAWERQRDRAPGYMVNEGRPKYNMRSTYILGAPAIADSYAPNVS